jgi:16S rRNA (guanine527-N7)-methyltransferase
MQTILSDGLTAFGLSPAPAAALEHYGRALIEQNKVMNLTAITDPVDVARLHMLDCAALLTLEDFSGKKVLDVGTGAGFPGLVLKLCQSDIDLTLLDALEKRIHWLEGLAPTLGAEGVTCIHGRAEEYAAQRDYREQFDIGTSRAVAELRVLSELCLPFVKVGGVFLAMKGAGAAQEAEDAGRAVSLLGGQLEKTLSYTIPGTDVTHRVVPIRKVRETPARFPRRFAKIKKQPL